MTPIRDMSFEVPMATSVALVGPSGSGKSSILLAIAGRIPLAEGRVAVDGVDLTAATRPRIRISLIDQDYRPLTFLNVLENVMLPLELTGASRQEAQMAARKQLSALGIAELERRHIHDISGGQRQRVVVARALVASPTVLLADEPTAALDRRTGLAVLDDAFELARRHKSYFVIATHDSEVARRCDAVVDLTEWEIPAAATSDVKR